jgi:hypothetical protein
MLLDDLVRPREQRRRDRETAESSRTLANGNQSWVQVLLLRSGRDRQRFGRQFRLNTLHDHKRIALLHCRRPRQIFLETTCRRLGLPLAR